MSTHRRHNRTPSLAVGLRRNPVVHAYTFGLEDEGAKSSSF
jgi:hypothetical protein